MSIDTELVEKLITIKSEAYSRSRSSTIFFVLFMLFCISYFYIAYRKLSTEIDSSKIHVSKMERQIEQDVKEISNSKIEIANLHKELDRYNTTINLSIETINDLKKNIEEDEYFIRQAREDIKEYRKDFNSIIPRIKALEEKIKK